MSASGDKWVMFKNYLHNELGIGREDIRNWIRDAVQDEARRIVAQEGGKFDTNAMIGKFVRDKVDSYLVHQGPRDLQGAVARLIVNDLNVSITPREQNKPET